jgi:hypothetical protein
MGVEKRVSDIFPRFQDRDTVVSVDTLKDYIGPFVTEDKELPHTLWVSEAILCDYASNVNYNVYQSIHRQPKPNLLGKSPRTHEHIITTFIFPKRIPSAIHST